MRRLKLTTIALLSLICTTLFAQQRSLITATVIDSADSLGMIGAVGSIARPDHADSAPKFTTSGLDGKLSFSSMEYGDYDLNMYYLGYDTLRMSVKVDRPNIDLGRVFMNVASQTIDNVVVEGIAMRTSQKGDTVMYNADAYKVNQDATADGLLSKMPGISVSEDGKVEAQGEEVQKVYIDGKEFFGEDAKIALKNIPADMISSIEVYNKLSDESELTGNEDGDTKKAINIVTKGGVNGSLFGKIAAAYTNTNCYNVSGNMSLFSDKHRLTVVAMSNNVNQQNFGAEDILGAMDSNKSGLDNFMVGFQPGLSSVNAVGINYAGDPTEKIEIDASYFYNYTDNSNEQRREREYLAGEDGFYRYQNSIYNPSTQNLNHRFRLKFEYDISDRQKLIMRPSASYQDYNNYNTSLSSSDSYNSDGFDHKLNATDKIGTVDRHGYSLSNSVLYRIRINDRGSSITANIGASKSLNDYFNTNNTLTTTYKLNGDITDNRVLQNRDNISTNYAISGGITYTEPISGKSRVNIQYRYQNKFSDANLQVYNLNEAVSDEYILSEKASSIYDTGYQTQSIGPGYNFYYRKSAINLSVMYQHAELSKSQTLPVVIDQQSNSFNNVVYYAMMRLRLNPTNSIRTYIRSQTINPSIYNLQSVVDDSNPLYIKSGNPALDPTYVHRIYANYIRSNVEKGRTFMVMVNSSITQDHIGNYIYLNDGTEHEIPLESGEVVTLSPNAEFRQPRNLDGKWDVRGMISFGAPITPIKCNFNINVNGQFAASPTMINDALSMRNNTKYWATASLGSNISENIDFTVRYSGSYNTVEYQTDVTSKSLKTNDNEYLTQSVRANFKIDFPYDITFAGNGTFTQYMGITDSDFNQRYTFIDLQLGKRIFRNKRGEIAIGVNDLLDNRETFMRNVESTYIENLTNQYIGRFYSLQFTYKFRSTKQGRSKSKKHNTTDKLKPQKTL